MTVILYFCPYWTVAHYFLIFLTENSSVVIFSGLRACILFCDIDSVALSLVCFSCIYPVLVIYNIIGKTLYAYEVQYNLYSTTNTGVKICIGVKNKL